MYGNLGVDDVEIIDAHLARLRLGGVVINLGCGPNTQGQLHNLARVVGYYQRQSTLVLADIDTASIEGEVWIPGPVNVNVVMLNAATATQVLGLGRADLILAFGLFGALSSRTTSNGTGRAAWPAVLAECRRMLRPAGRLLVSNSCERQPFEEFKTAVEGQGLVVADQHRSTAIWAKGIPGEDRYLAVCERSKQAKLSNGKDR